MAPEIFRKSLSFALFIDSMAYPHVCQLGMASLWMSGLWEWSHTSCWPVCCVHQADILNVSSIIHRLHSIWPRFIAARDGGDSRWGFPIQAWWISFRFIILHYASHLVIEEYWCNVSDTARGFVTMCLTVDQNLRPTAEEALKHKVHLL
jgi:hypothetical protein